MIDKLKNFYDSIVKWLVGLRRVHLPTFCSEGSSALLTSVAQLSNESALLFSLYNMDGSSCRVYRYLMTQNRILIRYDATNNLSDGNFLSMIQKLNSFLFTYIKILLCAFQVMCWLGWGQW